MRRAGRRDELHQAAGYFFRSRGWTGIDTASLGNDVPDWCFFKGTTGFALEVKSPKKIHHQADGVTDGQKLYHSLFAGLIFVAESIEDFWKILGKVAPERVAERIEPKEP